MKKYFIFTAIALVAFAVGARAQDYTFSNNLSVGSSGQDVVSLQTWLVNNGFDIPAVSSGVSAKGYFGGQTRTALAAYQKSIGLSNYGFFGPLTRGRLNSNHDQRGASLRVTSPNGGETWQKGTTQNITWTGSQGVVASAIWTGSIWLDPAIPACAEPTASIRCMIAVHAPYVIAQNVNLNSRSFAWTVGQILNDTQSDLPNIGTVSDGQYKVRICPVNSNASNVNSSACDSSDAYFNIASNVSNGNAPVINGIDAPTSLVVNQTGTWTVHATDPQNGTLGYSVDWGDVVLNVSQGYAASLNAVQFTQSTTFTHSYSNVGTYTVRFTVRNGAGLTAETSATVTVTSSTSAGSLKIISPNGGEVWMRGTTQTITWTSPYYFMATTADLRLNHQYTCTTQVCPAIAYAPYTIATGVPINQNSYAWNIGNVLPLALTSSSYASVPSGQYTVEICGSGTSDCDSSDATFTIN